MSIVILKDIVSLVNFICSLKIFQLNYSMPSSKINYLKSEPEPLWCQLMCRSNCPEILKRKFKLLRGYCRR